MGTHSTHQIAVVLPITIALMMIASTMVIHSLALVGIVDFIRRQRRLGRTGVRFWQDVAIVTSAMLLAGIAHIVEILMWALVFTACGEVNQLADAF